MRPLFAFAAVCALQIAALFPARTLAQDATDPSQVHPITLSPEAPPARPAKRTRRKAVAAPRSAAPAADIVPAAEVHPITSLPKPPGEAAAPPVVAPAAVSAPPPVSTPPAATVEAQPQPVTVPPSAAPAPAPPPQPVPVDVGPPAFQASVFPPAPAGHARPLPARMKPFGAIGVALTASFGGAGVDVAVPLAQRVNARLGASFFQYSGSYGIDGVTINGEVKFRDARFALDLFPFHGTKFHISPGVTLYNGNNLNASAFVPAGQTFTLNDVTYTSAANDPVNGSAAMTFGYRTAPSMTIGWGNLVPRKRSQHFSIPFEIGAQYIDNPKVSLYLQGTACSTESGVYGCGQLKTDPIAQANLEAEEQKINNQYLHAYLRFYPIISIGAGWSFNLRHDR